MRLSKVLLRTKKSTPKDIATISHKLLYRADYIDQLASGIFTLMPLGWRVHFKLQKLIRSFMDKLGAVELRMPSLQPRSLWEETGRWREIEPPLFKLRDQHDKEYALAPTHEEVVTTIAKKRILSYRDLPRKVYQIQNKFRNEIRSTGGLLRTREFSMKDLYSFHADEKDLGNFYGLVVKTYLDIYSVCQLNAIKTHADSGSIGGKRSHEFMVLSESGEDRVMVCKRCKVGFNLEQKRTSKTCKECGHGEFIKSRAIECGHTFWLGDHYSRKLRAYFKDKKGSDRAIQMGCYGIGIGRLLAAIVEVHHDQHGMRWPRAIAPFHIHLLVLQDTAKLKRQAEHVYRALTKKGEEVLFDDRSEVGIGEKLTDADLLGIPVRVVVSEKLNVLDKIEIKKRGEKHVKIISTKKLLSSPSEKWL